MRHINKILKKYNSIPIAAKATIWFMICSVVQKCISLITTPVFTRLMTTEQYGQFSVYNSWLQIFTIITTLRLNWSVFSKGMSKYKADRDGYTSTMQTLTCILTTIVLVIYLIFRKQINAITELPTYIMLAMFAELYLVPAIDFWTIRKRYEYIYKPVVFRTLLMAALNAAIGVIAVLLTEEKGIARILSCIFVNICFGGVLFVYNLRKGKKLFCAEYAKFALLFNLPLLLHYFSQYILDQFDRIMIQKMVDVSKAGIYSVAYNAGLIMKIVTQSINNVLVPWQYEQLEKKRMKEMGNHLFLIYIFVGGCALLFSACAPEIIKILADSKYYEAVYVIPPVAISMFFTFAYTSFANIEFFFDANKFTMFISMAGALLNIVLNYFGILWFGYIAAAYTTLVCYVIFSISHYVYMCHCIKKMSDTEEIFGTARLIFLMILVLAGGILVISLYDRPFLRYVLIIAVCFIVYMKRKAVLSVISNIRKKRG